MSLGGTASYTTTALSVPPIVAASVAEAIEIGFEYCVRPEIGRLLAVLAGGLPPGTKVGETGTGTGAGLAWMVTAAGPEVAFTSIELDPQRAAAASARFADHHNVRVVEGDAETIPEYGPFDLLVLDGGPGSGKGGDEPVDPARCLVPGGLLTVDDFTPMTEWPPMFGGEPDGPRIHWLEHPMLDATEVRVAADLAVIVARRRHP